MSQIGFMLKKLELGTVLYSHQTATVRYCIEQFREKNEYSPE